VTVLVIALLTIALTFAGIVVFRYHRRSAAGRRRAQIELESLRAQLRLRCLTEQTLIAIRREVNRHSQIGNA
jgi:hypothetical protein